MLKKRILISTLTFIFLVSTTGLPVTIDLCKMATKDADQCIMHQKPVKSMCCMDESSGNELKIFAATPNCCQVSFVYNKVESEFVNNKSEINFYPSFQSLIILVSSLPEQIELSFTESFYTDSSPPFLVDPEIHITNSSLLI